MNERLAALANAGVSIWLDDLSRERLASGDLTRTITEESVVGVTTNPSIFANALADGDAYSDEVARLAGEGADLATALRTLMAADVRDACDLFADIYASSAGYDGRVSIEVDPRLAHDTEGTLGQARELRAAVDRPNCLIKIPATDAGLPAITTALSEGISVNVTLIFSRERYGQVLEAWLAGLERAGDGVDLTQVHSVASFFISRVDSAVDARLEAIGTDEAYALRGKAGIANARLAHALFRETVADQRWETLAARGANVQRPLWASTSVKDPDYPDTMYITELVAAGVVNTMPESTLDAFADHGEVCGDTVTGAAEEAAQHLASLRRIGIDLDDVFATLEEEGVAKFVAAGEELDATVQQALESARS